MAITSIKVNELPLAADPTQFEIPGFDITTNAGAKARMSDLKGDKGDAPDVSIIVHTLPYGSTPTVDKSGTNTNPIFDFGLPSAKDGSTPMFQNNGTYIQYRYNIADAWQNLVALSELKGNKGDKMTYDDLTAEDIADLQRPATDAAALANAAATSANQAATAANTAADNTNNAISDANSAATDAGNAAIAANNAADTANTAAANVQDGKTPQFQAGTATSIPSDDAPTVDVTQIASDTSGNPIYSVSFGIPQGMQGAQGQAPIIQNGSITTGAPGSDAQLLFTYIGNDSNGSPLYTVSGSLPQGAPGDGSGNVLVSESGLIAGTQYVFVPNNNDSAIGTFQPITIPDTQEQADWNQTDDTQKDFIKNKPILANVALTGAYADLTGTPTLSPVATTGQYGSLTGLPNLTPSFQTDNSYAATATGVTENINIRSIQNGIGTPQAVQLPVANETNAGVMPASAFTQIQQNTANIQSIIQGGGKEWPSVETKADLDAFGMPSGATQNDVIKVRDDETQNGATTQYVATDTNGDGTLEWVFNLIVNFDPIGIATTTQTGVVKSSETDGQVMVEVDGTMSLVGYDEYGNRIGDLENDTVKLTGTQTISGVKNFQPNMAKMPVLDTYDSDTLVPRLAVDNKLAELWRAVDYLGKILGKSFWIDYNQRFHYFSKNDIEGNPGTPISAFATTSTSIVIMGETISKSIIEWVYFGNDYDDETELPNNFMGSTFTTLYNVSLPKNITTIGQNCLRNIPIYDIVIPDTVISIGQSSFINLPNLVAIHIGNISSSVTIASGIFQGISNISSSVIYGATSSIISTFKSKCPNISNWSSAIEQGQLLPPPSSNIPEVYVPNTFRIVAGRSGVIYEDNDITVTFNHSNGSAISIKNNTAGSIQFIGFGVRQLSTNGAGTEISINNTIASGSTASIFSNTGAGACMNTNIHIVSNSNMGLYINYTGGQYNTGVVSGFIQRTNIINI